MYKCCADDSLVCEADARFTTNQSTQPIECKPSVLLVCSGLTPHDAGPDFTEAPLIALIGGPGIQTEPPSLTEFAHTTVDHFHVTADLQARVFACELTGNETIVTCEVGKAPVVVKMDKNYDVRAGTAVGIAIDRAKLCLFDAGTGEKIAAGG